MSLSANALYHFTSFEALKGILRTRGFWPLLCPEKMPVLVSDAAIAIPMVCFCDIRLTQVSQHVAHYKPYAIGMTKAWGMRSGINPVMYLVNGSSAFDSIARSIGSLANRYDPGERRLRIDSVGAKVLRENLRLLCFTKPYEGQRWNKATRKFDGEVVRFYDEREWRYVLGRSRSPKGDSIPLDFVPMTGDELHPMFDIERLDSGYRNQPLTFTDADVRHVIVKTHTEYEEMIDSFPWSDVFSTKELFISKLRVYDQIQEDY